MWQKERKKKNQNDRGTLHETFYWLGGKVHMSNECTATENAKSFYEFISHDGEQ